MKVIPFSPPDISGEEIEAVVKVLKSGWITTGPVTKEFEQQLSDFCGTSKTVCLNSATAALELSLRLLGIGPGDEVITSAFTYTASASVIHHVGAKIVLVDTKKDSFEMDYNKVAEAINENTKAIIPVDIGGVMCDYDTIYQIIESKKHLFKANNELQKKYNRVIIVADAAHSLGATYKGKLNGQVADFTCFSFHAVKNLTTAEGGCVTWKDVLGIDNDEIYNELQLLSLHGQNKSALAKIKPGSWEYDIIYPAYKNNLTDIASAIGLTQLSRYASLLARRHEIVKMYNEGFNDIDVQYLDHTFSNAHLYILRINGIDVFKRNIIIEKMAENGISCNVHYKPIPMMTAYKNLGFDIKDYPNAYDFYQNEITLPLHTLLSDEDVKYIINTLKTILKA